MDIHIKNMVCNRCITAVDKVFRESGFQPSSALLGHVEIPEDIGKEELKRIGRELNELGFEIIEDQKSKVIEQIKNTVVEIVHYNGDDKRLNYSKIIESKLNRNYTYLNNLFMSVEGTRIEQYIIHYKIEKSQEYPVYNNELSISEMAFIAT